MKSKYSDTYFAFQYAVKHKDYTKWFSPVILAVDTWSIHVWQTEATRARCYLRREREGVKTQHNWHNSLACQRSPVYSAALSAVLTFLLAAFQPTTPVFPSTLALNMEDAYTVLCDIRARNKVFRRACSQVILLNHQIEAAKARYDRARAVKASFLPILQQTQAHKSRGRSQSCLRVRLCQVWRNRRPASQTTGTHWWCLRLWRIRRVWFWRPA